ncbi:trichohyalin-like isoform X3 [Mya arenaria]|uniref:trichohyalin-like isoform X3 n=1 Tax=Mya arenaria TaxID=6604 RepID=UPI0022E13252|nr:trichohyalin-like isoform X3 [Mya arenaria]
MMVQNKRYSASCYEIGRAPRADEEDVTYLDCDDVMDIEPDLPSGMSQRSSILTNASSRISLSSRATLLSSLGKDNGTRRSKKMVVCRVALLDGTTFEPKGIDKNSEGQQVFDMVAKHLDVIETDYFGLTFRDKTGKKYWLDNTKKISKQLKGGTWVFEFQVKFYPPDPMSLKEDITRYQLCLQVRVDIFNGRLPCSFATYALLGSYTVQAELGDWDQKDYGRSTDYLNDFDFAPNQNQELLDKIQELHIDHKGQTPTVAEAHFLENAKKLALYGVDMHDVKDSTNKRLSLGICATGVLVYRDRLRIDRFVWPKILKLSYKRNTFYIKLRPSEFDPHEKTVSFLCDNHKLAKRLWKTCVEHHAFFRLKTSEAPNADTMFPRFNTRFRYSGRTALQARKAAEMQDRDEPHIARTAERRSTGGKKDPEGDQLQKRPEDSGDMYDKKHGDPDATLERDRNLAGLDQDGKRIRSPEEEARLKQDYMRLLQETPSIHITSRYPESRRQIEHDPRFKAVGDEGLREKWFNEYVESKQDYMRLLQETPSIHSQSRYPESRRQIEHDPRFQAVGDEGLREKWFDEYVEAQKKADFMQLLRDTPWANSQSSWPETREEIEHDPRFQAVGDEGLREKWFNEFKQDMKNHKDEDKRRKKEDERRRKEKEKERKRLEKEKKKGKGAPDASYEEQKSPEKEKVTTPEKEKRFSGGLFGILGRKSQKEKSEEPKPHRAYEGEEEGAEEQKPKPVPTWALPGMKEMMEKKASSDQKEEEEVEPRLSVPEIKVEECGDNLDPDAQEYETDYIHNSIEDTAEFEHIEKEIQSSSCFENQSETVAEYQSTAVEQSKGDILTQAGVYFPEQCKEEFTQLLRETDDITSTTQFDDVRIQIANDPRYINVPSEEKRQQWFDEYVQDLIKSDFMRLLRETPAIYSQSTWPEARVEIDRDPRFDAVPNEELREKWFDEYIQGLLKSDYMQLLKDTPAVDSQSRFEEVRDYIAYDPRYQAVPTDELRRDWFNEFVQNLKKDEFLQLLEDTPSITSYSRYPDVKEDIAHDPRFQNVDTEEQREQYFSEYTTALKKAGYMQLLRDTPDISYTTTWQQARPFIETDPRYHAVDSDLQRLKWLNEHKNNLAGRGYAGMDFSLRAGGYKSIDRKQEFLPLNEPEVATKKPMPFFQSTAETDVDAFGRKKVPPPVAKKPRALSGYDSEEDRLMNMNNGVPVTVATETFKYNPDINDVPRSTSKIPIVETKTHKYKTERDGVVETRVERKITVTTDEDDGIDHDALLRAAIEEVTNMNPDMSVEKIECMRQIEEKSESVV